MLYADKLILNHTVYFLTTAMSRLFKFIFCSFPLQFFQSAACSLCRSKKTQTCLSTYPWAQYSASFYSWPASTTPGSYRPRKVTYSIPTAVSFIPV